MRSQSIPAINGIDYLEVENNQKKLKVYFIFDLPGTANPVPSGGQELTKENVVIEGGVRVKDIQVEDVETLKNILIVSVAAPGDYSNYTLRVTRSQTDLSVPDGFDQQLSFVDFSFKVSCPSEFDCRPATSCPPEKYAQPEINYLAKDYSTFRRLMLDRMSVLMPDWKERNPADLTIALIELLSYKADHLSYYQDAAATEAYLETARKKISLRRHARLLDYFMHEGCNARTWVCFEVVRSSSLDGGTLPERTRLLTKGTDDKIIIAPENFDEIRINEDPVVFETMHPARLDSYNNEIKFYTWSDNECCLPRGSTRATLINDNLSLKVGDVLIIEEVRSPATGETVDADLSHRHAVRLKNVRNDVDQLNGDAIIEIEWHEEDALPIPFCISAVIKDDKGTNMYSDMTVARGNVVLADHGLTIKEDLEKVPENGSFRPHLSKMPLTYRVPFDHNIDQKRSATSSMRQKPGEARPAISLNNKEWNPLYDLLASDRFSKEFVVENEADGTSYLRFGDGIRGRKPPAGAIFAATYRIGNGRKGNVGRSVITRAVLKESGISKIENPFAAVGGTEPEPLEEVRLFAPHVFRSQERMVTEEDYADMAGKHPEVQKAAATIRWTGSWHTAFITIDRKGGHPVDMEFMEKIKSFLERYRIAGIDIEINSPVQVPLEIFMKVCVKPGYFRSNVKQSLLMAFSNRELPDGKRGFFHPDNFTFNQPVYLSNIYRASMEISGVASVDVVSFKRHGRLPDKELENGVIVPGRLEIIQLENNPNFPENGKIDFEMTGGL